MCTLIKEISIGLKLLLTFVFVSFSAAPLNIGGALLLFFLFYPLELQLLLQDCLFSTLLIEDDKKIQKSETGVCRYEDFKNWQHNITQYLTTKHQSLKIKKKSNTHLHRHKSTRGVESAHLPILLICTPLGQAVPLIF